MIISREYVVFEALFHPRMSDKIVLRDLGALPRFKFSEAFCQKCQFQRLRMIEVHRPTVVVKTVRLVDVEIILVDNDGVLAEGLC